MGEAMRKIDKIIIHCAATKPSMDIGVKEITEWHWDRDWSTIGYHYVIRRNGTIETGRSKDRAGAHTKGQNANSLGVCLVGGINDKGQPAENFTKAQWGSLERLMRILKADFPWATIHGHREFNAGKACPSFDVQKWVRDAKL
jgi:N-acetyl-anhydromuramyl-L-alanine amidase AmpD